METYIVIQMCIEEEELTNKGNQVKMINIVRKVISESMESAIGEFVLNTSDIKVKSRLNIECYPISILKTI